MEKSNHCKRHMNNEKNPFPAYNFKKSGGEDFFISLMKFAFS